MLGVILVKLYQLTLSRFTPACWQMPSCSEYSVQAFRSHGFREGLDLTVKRIKTCNKTNYQAYLEGQVNAK